jgi:hypothetical protein
VSVPTLTPTPGAAAPGVRASARQHTPRPPITATEQAFQRAATDPDYFAWLTHVWPAAGCARPVRLVGELATIDPTTGKLLASTHTADLPDGVIYKACGNRRSSACPSCAQTYAGDAYQLIRAGLVGGKGVPATVARHAAVFVTLVAPSFGTVHTRRTARNGRQIPCRPRRREHPCPHGVDLRCHRIHADGEQILGTPLCLDCYDHAHQVVWNNQASELWRRTRIATERHLRRTARRRGIPAKTVWLSYGKVAEMQRRGAVHYHAIIRLDGADPDHPEEILPPPAGIGLDDLLDAVTEAAAATAFTTDPHPAKLAGWPIGWGDEGKGVYADVRPVRINGDGQITDGMVAAYLAKYATKSTEATGHLSRRLDTTTIDLHADSEGTHTERLIDACWTLGQPKQWQSLRRWAHMLGFGGHFLTKSRRYSVTFRILRDNRVIWRRTHDPAHDQADAHTEETTLVLGLLTYAGAGWRTTGDALLANTAAALARDRERLGREEAFAA